MKRPAVAGSGRKRVRMRSLAFHSRRNLNQMRSQTAQARLKCLMAIQLVGSIMTPLRCTNADARDQLARSKPNGKFISVSRNALRWRCGRSINYIIICDSHTHAPDAASNSPTCVDFINLNWSSHFARFACVWRVPRPLHKQLVICLPLLIDSQKKTANEWRS